jgi:CheY-like chemotaxis protein
MTDHRPNGSNMANVKQILVVDDHFEMLEFLRSMLELSGHDYEVLAVPSAEEGLLELQRTNFDLLITDVRLPGMSGFDLIRRVRRLKPNIAVIMITAYSTSQGKQEAEDLNVYRYFTKPLDTDAVLAAVYTALYGETADSPIVADSKRSSSRPISTRVQHRLNSLRADTGATGLVLARLNGEILYRAGSHSAPIDLDKLVAVVARNIENGFDLIPSLGGEAPFTIQYHAGEAYELYNANIGRDFFITMYFDVTTRRGRIGTIWIFAQRAIKELFQMLPEVEAATGTPPVNHVAAKPLEQPAAVKPAPPPAPVPEEEIDYDVERIQIDEIPSWSEIVPEEENGDLSELLAVLNLSEEAVTADLENFWDEAALEPEDEETGISFDEAMRRGLISLENENEEETEES